MAVRLLEMKRILKDTGSIYLHCDPTMSHYLKLIMDAIFGQNNFRNEVTWKRRHGMSSAIHSSNRFGICTDIILFYAASNKSTFQPQYNRNHPLYVEYVKNSFRLIDDSGRKYQATSLTNPSYRPNLIYEYKGYKPPKNGWMITKEKMEKWDKEGRIHFPKNKSGRLRRKSFADELKGMPIQNLWDDIQQIGSHSDERTGYPTQKPLALLERIIKASSNDNDVVFDPFCGCATTMVAADRLQRQWVGIDLSSKAVELVEDRIRQDQGGVGRQRGVFENIIARKDIPQRTDIDVLQSYNSADNKRYLYGQQAGHCNGCKTHFEIRHLEVDHIIAKSQGGTDHIENLQLLCGNCNRVKGNRGQEYLIAKLKGKQVSYA